MPINLEGCSLDELKVIKASVEEELKKAEQMAALVKSLSNIQGFPYAIFEVFGALQDGVTVLSEDLKVLWANETAVKQLARSKAHTSVTLKDLVGNHCYRNLGRDAPCVPCACLEAMDTKKTQLRHNYSGPLPDVSYDIWAIPIYNGSRACILITREAIKETPDERANEHVG